MLTPFGTDIWLADGPAVTAIAGFHYPTRMSVIRLTDGGLFLWSPVALTPALLAAVRLLGPVRHIVAPNDLHHLSLTDWIAACPEAEVYAAPRLAAKRPDVAFDGTLGPAPHPAWAGQIDQVLIDSNRVLSEVVFHHRASGTTLFVDLIQHLPRGWFRGWRAVVARLDGMSGPAPDVPRKFRAAFRDRAMVRQSMREVMAWQTKALVFAHGAPVTTGAQAALAHAFRWLKP